MTNRYDTPPASELTDQGRCSDCGVRVIWAADGLMQVCPRCFSVLWHDDTAAKEKHDREVLMAAQRERNSARHAARIAEREVERARARAEADAKKDHKL